MGRQMQLRQERVCDLTNLHPIWRGTLEGLLEGVVDTFQACQLFGVDLEHFALD